MIKTPEKIKIVMVDLFKECNKSEENIKKFLYE